MAAEAEVKRARSELASTLGRVQLVVFILGTFLITSQMLLPLLQGATFYTSDCQGTAGCRANIFTNHAAGWREGIMGPSHFVAGLTEELASYGFVSAVCSNTSTITLLCLTGRVPKWPRSSFVSRMELTIRREDKRSLDVWSRIVVYFLCQATNCVATIITYTDWLLAPLLASKCATDMRTSFLARVLEQAVSHLTHAWWFVSGSLTTVAAIASILVALALVHRYCFQLIPTWSSEEQEWETFCSTIDLLTRYSGLRLLWNVLDRLLGIFLDLNSFLIGTVNNELILVYACGRLLCPSLLRAIPLSVSQRIMTVAVALVIGITLKLVFGRLLNGPPRYFEEVALLSCIKPSNGKPDMPQKEHNLSDQNVAEVNADSADCFSRRLFRLRRIRSSLPAWSQRQIREKRILSKPSVLADSQRSLRWVLLCGNLWVLLPCMLGFSLVSKAIHQSLSSYQYLELRQLHPFSKPHFQILPLGMREPKAENYPRETPGMRKALHLAIVCLHSQCRAESLANFTLHVLVSERLPSPSIPVSLLLLVLQSPVRSGCSWVTSSSSSALQPAYTLLHLPCFQPAFSSLILQHPQAASGTSLLSCIRANAFASKQNRPTRWSI
jgi:hypothetical protein